MLKYYQLLDQIKGLGINNETFKEWFNKLEEVVGNKITNYDEYLEALKKRVEFSMKLDVEFQTML